VQCIYVFHTILTVYTDCFPKQHFPKVFVIETHVILLWLSLLFYFFLHSYDHALWRILIIKPTRCTNFWILVCNEILCVLDSSFVHHQEFFTVHTAMVYVIQVCWQLASRTRMELQFHPDPARKLSTNLYDIYRCCVYSEKLLMMDRESVRNM